MLNAKFAPVLNIPDIVLISIGSAIIFIVLLYIIAAIITFFRTVYKHEVLSYSTRDMVMGKNYSKMLEDSKEKRDALERKHYEKLTVKSSDNLTLTARFFPSKTGGKDTVICLHGYTSSGTIDFSSLFDFYEEKGFNILMPDSRAHGESEGKIIGFGVLERYDVLLFADLIAERFPKGNILIHGISLGATAALMASGLDISERVKAIVADSSFTRPWDIFSIQMRTIFKLPPFPILHMAEALTKIVGKYDFRSVNSADSVKRSKIPTLFIHGSDDIFVPQVMSKISFDALEAPKDLLIVEGAGHSCCHYHAKELYEEKLTNFLQENFK